MLIGSPISTMDYANGPRQKFANFLPPSHHPHS